MYIYIDLYVVCIVCIHICMYIQHREDRIFVSVTDNNRKEKFEESHYSNFRKLLAVQNSFAIAEELTKINHKNAKTVSVFDFSTLYTSIPHNLIILWSIINHFLSLYLQKQNAVCLIVNLVISLLNIVTCLKNAISC